MVLPAKHTLLRDMRIFTGWCRSDVRLDGKTAVVTGCNTGIGKFTVLDFVKRGARVVMACRNVKAAEKAADDIRRETSELEGVGEIVVVQLDLASLSSVEQCALHILQIEERINLLVNNAGILGHPRAKTEDGFEVHFGVNHLGHFLFTCLLLPRILRSAPARIINVSSWLHWLGNIDFDDLNSEKWETYYPTILYGRSKLANIMFTQELARRLQGTGVTTYSLHPGVVSSELYRNNTESYGSFLSYIWNNLCLPLVSKNPEAGAQTTIYCAVEENLANESGYFYSDCARDFISCRARDSTVAQKLWEESARLVGIENWDPFTAPDTNPVKSATPNPSSSTVTELLDP